MEETINQEKEECPSPRWSTRTKHPHLRTSKKSPSPPTLFILPVTMRDIFIYLQSGKTKSNWTREKWKVQSIKEYNGRDWICLLTRTNFLHGIRNAWREIVTPLFDTVFLMCASKTRWQLEATTTVRPVMNTMKSSSWIKPGWRWALFDPPSSFHGRHVHATSSK